MAILNNNPLIGASGNQGGYNINNSLRFRSSASAYLSRTPASAGNRQIMTYSFWVKRGAITGDYNLTNATTDASNSATLYFNSSNNQTFDVFLRVGATNYSVTTSQVFRDPSAWYHIVVAIDTTQATASNRTKVYVNGTQVTAFLTANYVPQNSNLALNNNVAQYIGYSNYFDGYMAEINFIDGQALTPSSFGETDTTTGVWKPKAYSGTYGTNGFYLKFSDIATTSGSNAGLGKDFSGNSNYWTTNNISVTSGTTYDAMTDSPTNTSATVANYAVMNSAAPYGSFLTLSEANLKSTCNGAYWAASPATFGVSSGKWYWEVYITNKVSSVMVGITKDTDTGATTGQNVYPGVSANSYGYVAGGLKYNNATGTSYGATYTTNDIIGVALDLDAGTLVFYKNNTSQGTAFSSLSGTYLPSIGVNDTNTAVSVNFGQRPFSYTPPTGFVALNTYNLPTPTILQGNKYMDATLYTGNGSTQSITNAGAFRPDFVWIKRRDGAGQDHVLQDSNRGFGGTTKLASSSTAAENTTGGATGSEWGSVTAANSNGFSITASTSGDQVNKNTWTYVGWQWQAGQGSTSSNTSGSITSTVSVNATAGFSIVTYTGTGANATVGHGLGVAPKMVIAKGRNTTSADHWRVYHTSLGGTQVIMLNLTNAASSSSVYWNNTNPTSSVFSLGTDASINENTKNFVAYCWAEIAGFSAFGSYTGNGSADGPFVFTGFRPKYVFTKRTDTTSDWIIYDTSRNTYNVTDLRLFPNLSNAETQSGAMDLLSNGFKLRDTGASQNASGGTYIFMAFAENPFKNSLAR